MARVGNSAAPTVLPLSSPIDVYLEARAESSICIENFRGMIDSIARGEFYEHPRYFESESIPLQTTSKRNTQKIKFGVTMQGGSQTEAKVSSRHDMESITYLYLYMCLMHTALCDTLCLKWK